MQLNFTNILNNTATILLYKTIGGEGGIDGAAVASEINYLNEYCKDSVKNINVRINSDGGSVHDGLSICSAILNSEIPVTTIIDGMAYSMAGVIAMCGTVRKIADYGTFMMHNVSGGNGDEDILNLLTTSLAKIFERTTCLTLDVCKDLMSKETWMSAEECYSMGLVNEIVLTKAPKPEIESMDKQQLHAFYNKFLIKPKKMTNLINKLKLSNDASENEIIEKVTSIEVEADTAKAENDALKTENENLKSKLKEYEDAEAAKEAEQKNSTVENAVKEGKITTESKDQWLNTPIKSTDLKNLFDSMKATPAFVNVLDAAIKEKKSNTEDRSKWSYSDWEKKDSKGLAEIQQNNPVEFERLVNTINTTIKSKR